MTATEMAYEFDVGYDFITNFEAPGIEPKEKSTFLTQAQEQLVLDIRRGNAFVETGKRILDILKTPATLSSFTTGPYPNSFWVDLPTGVFAVANEGATLTPTSSHFYYGQTLSGVRVKPIDDDYYYANINNPYKKPKHDLVWRLDYGENDAGTWKSKLVYIVGSNLTLTNVKVYYYRKPSPIIMLYSGYLAGDGSIDGVALTGHTATNRDCELNKIVHREIVDRAVKLAYAALQDEKGFQISSVKEQQTKV